MRKKLRSGERFSFWWLYPVQCEIGTSYLEAARLVRVFGESSACGWCTLSVSFFATGSRACILTRWCMPTFTHATKSSWVMFSPSKNRWKSTIGEPGKFMFHILLEEGSVSFLRETARLYRAQLALLSNLLEPTTVCIEFPHSLSGQGVNP